jgi:hypothetical protein
VVGEACLYPSSDFPGDEGPLPRNILITAAHVLIPNASLLGDLNLEPGRINKIRVRMSGQVIPLAVKGWGVPLDFRNDDDPENRQAIREKGLDIGLLHLQNNYSCDGLECSWVKPGNQAGLG